MKKAVLSVLLLAGACAPKGPFLAGDPLRPKPVTVAPPVVSVQDTGPPPDCDVVTPRQGSPAVPYAQRDEPTSKAIYKDGLNLLFASEDATNQGGPPPDAPAQDSFIQAVKKFQAGLGADPYNVLITYNLAAAYARVSKTQCSLNLLARLAEYTTWPSRKSDASTAADRLLGRGKWRGKPDPDFDGLRNDDRFRAVVKSF